MIFVTCIQDNIYLNWQAELLYYNLSKFGAKLITLCGYISKPSKYALQLEKNLNNYILIEDTRLNKDYAATMQPFLLSKYRISEPYFLCDSDVLFKNLEFIKNDNFNRYDIVGSNCNSYIDNNYINRCDNNLLRIMCDTINISYDKIVKNKYGIGAQYLFNNVPTCDLWKKVELDSNKLYSLLSKYKCSNNNIQIWTSEMWAILFNLVEADYSLYSDKSFNFSWASDNISTWDKNNIFHCAGVTSGKDGHFYKGNYIKYTPFFQDLSYVKHTSCSSVYSNFISEYKKVRNIK